METIIKQGVGIDISKSDFMVCICTKYSSGNIQHSDAVSFKNDKVGFNQFLKWVSKRASKELPVYYAMEATGVYHENLAHHLHKAKKRISIILPTSVKYFARSLNEKSKTDAVDAYVIARMVAERNLLEWTPPKQEYMILREFSRFRGVLISDRVRYKNILESLTFSADTPKAILKMTQKMIETITKEVEKIEEKMRGIVNSDEGLRQKVANICTIPGVGFVTAITVISETLGFELFNNCKQVTSYAGFDVVERQSGSSVKGKSRISKKGNSNLRRCLYLPALSAFRNVDFKAGYQRILSQGKPAKVGLVAVARKVLLLIYTLWKSGEPYKSKPKIETETSGN